MSVVMFRLLAGSRQHLSSSGNEVDWLSLTKYTFDNRRGLRRTRRDGGEERGKRMVDWGREGLQRPINSKKKEHAKYYIVYREMSARINVKFQR